jgi:hypothetical protein
MSTNKTLNDLFRAARSGRDAEPEIVSQREAADLLRSNSLRSVPQSSTIGHRLYERMLSTPLRIGLTAMTTASLVTIGALLLPNLFSHPNAPMLPAHTLEAHAIAPVTPPTPAAPSRPEATAPTQAVPAVAVRAAVPPVPPLPTVPTTVSDTLQPYDIPVEKLAELGIKLEDNGDIDFYTTSKDGKRINRFGLPATWGMRLHLGEELTAKDIEGLQIPRSAPRLVTSPSGAKRMFSFESDTSFTKLLAGQRMFVAMNQSLKVLPGDSLRSLVDRNVIVNVFSDSSRPKTDFDFDFKFDSDSMFAHMPRFDNRALQNMNVDTAIARAFRMVKFDSLVNVKELVKIYSDSSFAPNAFKFEMDSTFRFYHNGKGKGKSFNGFFSDSNNKWMKRFYSLDSNGGMVMRLQHLSDSLGKLYGNVDQLHSQIWKQFKSPKAWKFNDSNFYRFRGADSNGFWNRNYHDSLWKMFSVSFDKLVPIRVRNTKNPDHPNELIFWYESTPDIRHLLPPSRVATIQPQHITTAAYPNPTTGPVTIQYELKDVPKVHFSVRNLLGQEVMDGGETSTATGEQHLDLSSLEAGVYLLVSTTDDGERSVERIVVTK